MDNTNWAMTDAPMSIPEIPTFTAVAIDEAPRPRGPDGRFLPTPGVNDQYLKSMLASIGVRETQVPEAMLQEWGRIENRTAINGKVLEWYSKLNATEQNFNPDDISLFQHMLRPDMSGEARDLDARMASLKADIRRRFDSINQFLAEMAQVRERRMLLEGRGTIDLSDEITKILADGWFKYESSMTHNWNETHTRENQALLFTTSRVFMKHYNQAAAIDTTVDMGIYKVVYMPGRNKICVYGHEDYMVMSEHCHPHVSTGHDVCWGNASTTYTEAMRDAKPSRAFSALRVILSTYNDENPFIEIDGFILERDPNALENYPLVYAPYRNDAWIWADDLPSGIPTEDIRDSEEFDAEDEDEAGRERMRVRLYVQQRGSLRVNEDEYFVRIRRDGQIVWHEIDDSDIQEWN